MNKEELLKLINDQWETVMKETTTECDNLFHVKDGNLPKNPEWKGWMLGITEGINRSFGSLYRKVNTEMEAEDK